MGVIRKQSEWKKLFALQEVSTNGDKLRTKELHISWPATSRDPEPRDTTQPREKLHATRVHARAVSGTKVTQFNPKRNSRVRFLTSSILI